MGRQAGKWQGRQVGRQAGGQAGIQASRPAGRQAGKWACRQVSRHAGRQVGTQAGRCRQAGRQAGREVGILHGITAPGDASPQPGMPETITPTHATASYSLTWHAIELGVSLKSPVTMTGIVAALGWGGLEDPGGGAPAGPSGPAPPEPLPGRLLLSGSRKEARPARSCCICGGGCGWVGRGWGVRV